MAVNAQPETEISIGADTDLLPARPVHGREFKLTTDATDKRGPTNVVLLRVPEGVPETWTQAICDLLAMACPASYPAERWNVLCEDTYCFLRDWAAQAHDLGWTAHDLFGTHPEKPWIRFDCMGLVPLLNGAKVTALSDTKAVIERPNGARVTYYRRDVAPDEACLVWELKPCPNEGSSNE